ncbi:hypothetical protein P170DRAFT_469356 [Aspergillus steynii IBT 23096]|uniref:Uncharacterized protein n=1 Tax=Aspergillus steynii IBT 23096 TaxID=1392250 RepID=A0A2I2GLV2_9EURO|nr:uncharacterized protein P170DRAFT_469356 [Aspergillus steynii IBT 23096]PLB53871.1 hypothetical protein P170DRAFT_469356 [Aspergillus steynii IBT 23096]
MDGQDPEPKRLKSSEKKCSAFGSPAWIATFNNSIALARKTCDEKRAEWTIRTPDTPTPTDIPWRPDMPSPSQTYLNHPQYWCYFGDEWLGKRDMPPDHAKLSDSWVCRVLASEKKPTGKTKITAAYRGKAWKADFDQNGTLRTTRFPRGKPVIVYHGGKNFIPVAKYYYVLCGEEWGLKFAAWLINGVPAGGKKAANLSPNIVSIPPGLLTASSIPPRPGQDSTVSHFLIPSSARDYSNCDLFGMTEYPHVHVARNLIRLTRALKDSINV